MKSVGTKPFPVSTQPDPLAVFTRRPPTCSLFEVPDNRSFPILKKGETAVVDKKQRRPVDGQLYVIRWNSGQQSIVHARHSIKRLSTPGANDSRETSCFHVGDYVQPRSMDDVMGWARMGILRTSDGPYLPDHLEEKLVGRIIGVLVTQRTISNLKPVNRAARTHPAALPSSVAAPCD